ncbi:MAG: VOC family protein [Planctomycetota bacterium]
MSTGTESHTSAYATADVLPKTFGLYILYVTDWEPAVAFYRDTLGWTLLFEEPHGWAEFQTGGVRFALHPAGAGQGAPIDTHLSLFVADVDASIAALAAKDVKITAQPRLVCEGVRSAAFADHAGNVFHLNGK